MLLKANNLHKYYDENHVLKGVDMEINKGEIVAITGPSGAGKTTLLQLISTLDRISQNKNLNTEFSSVLFEDLDLTKLSDSKLARFRNEQIGFIFQFHQLLPEFTVEENILMPAWIMGKDIQSKKDLAMQLAIKLGIENKMKRLPQQLSGGEQQRVAIARALINRPKIVFADEPSGNLDTHNAEQLHQLFYELKELYGCSFVVVTHNLSLAQKSDRQIKMQDGKIID